VSSRTLTLDDRLYSYLQSVSLREPEVLVQLRAETARLPAAGMQISPEQGQFMALLVQLLGARNCLEVGTFTGYSALACARVLPAGGQLVALDSSPEWTAIGRRYWELAGVSDRIELRLGDAALSLQRLLEEGRAGSFDFMFIDADKPAYDRYYEFGLELVRPGGLIAFDNVLWSGRVADPNSTDEDTRALRALNRKLHHDPRIDIAMLPLGDGLTLARRRPGTA
jgi:predicted O-methyltransferase YrrM